MRVYLDDLALLVHGASISRGDEVLERDDDDTGWGRERRKVDPLVLVGSGKRWEKTVSVMPGICGRQTRGWARLGRWIADSQ